MSWVSLDTENKWRSRRGGSMDTGKVSENVVLLRNKTGSTANLWRPSSLVNLVNPARNRSSTVFDTGPTTENANELPKTNDTALVLSKTIEKPEKVESSIKKTSGVWGTLVSIVLVEAKGLPSSPNDGMSHGVYCKLRLGSQTLKSKTVQNLLQPEWRERFQLHLFKNHLLKISLWDKGRQKNFMGSSVLDLSQLEKERTHEIWQQLDDGYGSVHLSVTICNIRRRKVNKIEESEEIELENKHEIFNPNADWRLVGRLHVKVVSAKGLSGRPSAYCSLEVDNERVRTHNARSSAEPTWNKSFVFNVYDVTSTLDLKVRDSSIMTSLGGGESLGKISIPLLRIRNGEMKWYALKDKSKRGSAKGNCPRVLLEMSLFWNPINTMCENQDCKVLVNIFYMKGYYYGLYDCFAREVIGPKPGLLIGIDGTQENIKRPFRLMVANYYERGRNGKIKASLRVFQPREVKYIKKPQKFDISLVYKNLEFVRDTFNFICVVNEGYKSLFEWESLEMSITALSCWLLFWYHFKLWTAPLLLLVPFFYFWICNRHHLEQSFMRGYGIVDSPEKESKGMLNKMKIERSLTGRLQELPEMTMIITNGVDYIASLSEKIYNLASFKVPFLSYLTMTLLVVASAGLYLIPFNYIMMILGVYKFTRKYLRPDRTPNNDLEDFLSRIPDTEILNEWKELNVPEPSPVNGINIGTNPYTIKDSVMY